MESGQGHSQKLIRALTKAPLQRAVTQKRAASKTRLLRIILLRQLYTTSLCRIFALHLLALVKLIMHRRDNTATHKTMPHRDHPRRSLRDIFFAKYHIHYKNASSHYTLSRRHNNNNKIVTARQRVIC